MTTDKLAPVPDEYTAIAAWGEWMHSFAYYIEQEQRAAVREGVPLNALFKGSDGAWVTMDQLDLNHAFHNFYRGWLEARQAALRG